MPSTALSWPPIHSPASVHDTNFLQYCTVFSRHSNQSIKKVYADKGYAGLPNRNFLSENKIADGIMRKDSTTAKLTEREIERNKKIFTPLNHVWNLFNRGPRCGTSPAQLEIQPGKSSILESVIFTTKPSELDLQRS